jgi:outer membrane receptor protein involved in Fe transport
VNYSLRQTHKTTSDFYNNILNTPGHIPLNEYRNWRPYRNGDGSLNYANPNNYFNDYFFNPFMAKDMNRENDRYGYFVGNLDLSYQATDWLSATYRLGLTNESYDYLQTGEEFKYNAYAKSTGKYIAKDVSGYSGDFIGFNNKLVQDIILSFKKDFGPIKANLIVGNNVREERKKGVSASASQLVLPGVYNISNRIGETSGGESLSLARVVGYYGDLTLGYNDYLFLHVSGRNDSYSVLSKTNRSFFYPGADISFVASDAIPSLKDNSFLSYAKFTASATKVGNVNVDPYQLQTVFSTGAGFPYGSTAGFSVGDTYADPNLKPEFTTSYEVGGDFAFVDNRVSLELAYYTQETTNQTVSIDIATSTGFSRARVNAGSMRNKGFEASLKVTPISTADGFKWDVGAVYANQSSTVTSLYGDLQNINISNLYGLTSDGSLGQIFAQVGAQYPVVKAVAYLRDPEGRVVVDPSTGYPLKDPALKTMGQANPRHKLSLSTSAHYKGFTLSVLGEYRGGYVVYHGTAATMWFTGVAEATAAYNRERFVFPNSSYQTADGSYVANTTVATKDGGLGAWDTNLRTIGENFVTSGEFWKLRELSLSYNFPKSMLSGLKYVKGATVGLVGRNLFIWVPEENKYADPELSVSTSNAVGLNATTNTPSTRTYGFNVTLTF